MRLRADLQGHAPDPDLTAKMEVALDADDLVAARALSNRPDLPADEIAQFWSHSSARDMALRLLMPDVTPTADIARTEVLDIVPRIMAASGEPAEVDYLTAVFEANVPHRAAQDLIFWPDADWLSAIGRTIAQGPRHEDVVDQALKG